MSTVMRPAADMPTLAEIARAIADKGDVTTKASCIWAAYERHFALRDQPIRIMEVAMSKGGLSAVLAAMSRALFLTGIDVVARQRLSNSGYAPARIHHALKGNW
jgi:hypothetical protein